MIGNGHMILDRDDGEEIESYDVIVRMNGGSPKGKEKHVGTRTDILGITVPPKMPVYLKEFNPTYTIWLCLNLGTKIPESIQDHVYSLEYSIHYWPLCHRLGNSCPSTGMQLLDMLVRNTNFKNIKLFGYDFCKTHSWYAKPGPGARDLGGKWPAVHEHEKRYAEKLIIDFPNIEVVRY